MFKYLQKDFEPNLRFPGQHYTLFRQEHKQIMTFMYYLYIYLCTGVKFCTTFILIYVLQCTVLYYLYTYKYIFIYWCKVLYTYTNLCSAVYSIVDFKSHYIKIKRSKHGYF